MKKNENIGLLIRIPLYLLTGILCGIIISVYKLGIHKVSVVMKNILNSSNKFIFILIFVIIASVIYILNNREENIKGSGIPSIYAIIFDNYKFNYLKTFIYKFFASVITVGMGLTMGREGPSVQLGGLVGKLIYDKFKLDKSFENFFVGSSSGAGLAVAFNAPLTGVLFSIEEIYKKTSKKEFLSSSITVFSAVFISDLLLGNKSALIDIPKFNTMKLSIYLYILIFGIFIGLSGALFNIIILNSKKIMNLLPIHSYIKFLIPFIVTAIFLLMDGNLFGAGENLIMLPIEGNFGILRLILYYFIKLFLLFLVFGVDVPGGSLVPLLVLGSLAGNIYGSILAYLGLISPNLILIFSMIGMCGHFSSIVRAPLVAVILVLEMTGSAFTYLLPMSIVSLIAYLIAELLNIDPFYEKSYFVLKEKIKKSTK